MADSEHREIFIIKRHVSHDSDYHGGAWKIAFADFMTAMMALFLVLWLISSTSEKTKHTVAQYFNPVKLVDMTTLKKGFRDPKETEMGSGPNVKESPEESNSSRRNPAKAKDEIKCEADTKTPSQTEAALFRDPYAALAEIAANGSGKAAKSSSGAGMAAADDAGKFSDPFTTTPHEEEPQPESLLSLSLAQGTGAHSNLAPDKGGQEGSSQGKAAGVRETAEAAKSEDAAEIIPSLQTPAPKSNAQGKEVSHADASAEAARQAAVMAAKLKSDITKAIGGNTHAVNNIPNIEVQATPEGILISLTVFDVRHRVCRATVRNRPDYGKDRSGSQSQFRLHHHSRSYGWPPLPVAGL